MSLHRENRSTAEDSTFRQGGAKAAAMVFLGALLLLLVGLGDRDIEDRAEARIPVVALDILRTGRLVPPYLLGEPYLNKPPLHHLLCAAAIEIAGVHDRFVVRLPSALCGAIAVAITMLLGRRMGGSAAAGATAATFLLLCFKFFQLARSAELEILLVAATTVAYLGIAVRKGGIAAVGVAVATLAKGPVVAILFPVVFLAADALVTRSARAAARMLPWMLLGAAAGAAAYFGPLLATFGGLDELRRRAAFDNVLHRRPFHYYAWQLPLGLLPAGLALPWMIARLKGASTATRACVAAVALGAVAFSAFPSKQSHYLLPLYPLVAVWAGIALGKTIGNAPRIIHATIAIACVIWPVGVVAGDSMVRRRELERGRPAAVVLREFAAAAHDRRIAMRERHPVIAWHLDRPDLEIRASVDDALAFLAAEDAVLVVDLEKGEEAPAELAGFTTRREAAADGHTYLLLEGARPRSGR